MGSYHMTVQEFERLDQNQLLASVDLPPDGFLIGDVHISLWGHRYSFDLLVGESTTVRAKLMFEDVQQIHWESLGGEADERDTTVQVIGIELGEPDHQKPAIIHTNLFEIHLTYGSMKLVAV